MDNGKMIMMSERKDRSSNDIDTQIMSLENENDSTKNLGREHHPKHASAVKSEFRRYFDKEQLPITIKREGGERVINWSVDIDTLDYHHFLPIFLSGLQEKSEPYSFVSYEGSMELIENAQFDSRVLLVLPLIMKQIKSALNTRDSNIINRTLAVLQQIIVCEGVGEAITEYYRVILPICNILKDKRLGTGRSKISELITETLELIEIYGKDDSYEQMQQFVPSLNSCIPMQV